MITLFTLGLTNKTAAQTPIPSPCPIKNTHAIKSGSLLIKPQSILTDKKNNPSSVEWINPMASIQSDDIYTTIELKPGERSATLLIQNFDLHIPPASIVHGLAFNLEGHTNGGQVQIQQIQLIDQNQNPIGANKNYIYPSNAWQKDSLSKDYLWTYGSSKDQWSANINTSLINSINFGLSIKLKNIGNTNLNVRIDKIELIISYEEVSRMCMKNCAVFFVDPIPNATSYAWQIPNGASITSESSKSEIVLNLEAVPNGVHEICVNAVTPSGVSATCCKKFLLEDCSQSSIGDKVWRDDNANGIQDTNEPGLKGILVHLVDALTRKVIDTKTSDDQGKFLFTNLIPSYYYLQFGFSPDLFISKYQQGANKEKDSDLDNSNGAYTTPSFYLSPNEQNKNMDLGLYQYSSIGDYVWLDANENGTQDKNEHGLQGIKLYLYNYADILIDSTTTDSGGLYKIDHLLPNKYYLKSALPLNYNITKNNVSRNSNTDSDFFSNQKTDLFELPFYFSLTDIDLGLIEVKTAIIQGNIWYDAAYDGIWDPTDRNVSNCLITLYDSQNKIIDSTRSNINGFYQFNNVRANSTYSLKIKYKDNYSFTQKDASGYEYNDSDVDDKGEYNINNLMAGTTSIIDAGILFDCGANAGNILAMSSGMDCLHGERITLKAQLNAGQIIPEGYTISYILSNTRTQKILGISNVPNFQINNANSYAIYVFIHAMDTLDFNYIDLSKIKIGVTSLINFTTELVIKKTCFSISQKPAIFVIYDCINIKGSSFNDLNNNNIIDNQDLKNNGQKLFLLNKNLIAIDSTITDINGEFKYENLNPALEYFIKFEPLQNQNFIIKGNQSDPYASHVDATGLSDEISISPGTSITINAGYQAICNIQASDMIASIIPSNCYEGTPISINAIPNGAHKLDSLYKVSYLLINDLHNNIIEISDDPNFTITAEGRYAIFAFIYNTNLTNPNFIDIKSIHFPRSFPLFLDLIKSKCYSLSSEAAIFELFDCKTISGYVWNDENHDGIQDINEKAINDIPIQLWDMSNNLLTMTKTDSLGNYQINSIASGDYILQTIKPANYIFTLQDQGINDTIDSDVDGTGAIPFTIFNNNTITKIDIGLYAQSFNISGSVWLDDNFNGLQEITENKKSNIKIELYNSEYQKIDSTISNQNGQYYFNAPSGDYFLEFNVPDPMNFSPYTTSDMTMNSDVTGRFGRGTTDMFRLSNTDEMLIYDAGISEANLLAIENITLSAVRKNADAIINVSYINFKGQIILQKLNANTWKNVTSYETSSSDISHSFEYIDQSINQHDAEYYRLEYHELNKSTLYSRVISLKSLKPKVNCELYQNFNTQDCKLVISTPLINNNWYIVNGLGHIMQTLNGPNAAILDFNISHYSKGIYYIISESNPTLRAKFIKL